MRNFDTFKNKRVFVTGHTGFKGSWLCEWLLELGANVRGYSLEPHTTPNLFSILKLQERVDHVVGDINDIESLQTALCDFQPEIIFHLAAQPIVRLSYATPLETLQTNIIGTANILEAIRSCPSAKSVVIVTSDKCYENNEKNTPFIESDPMGGHDIYSVSKGCAELVTSAYVRSFFSDSTVKIATARAGNVIGGGDWAPDRLIPDVIRASTAGEAVRIRNPQATRPWQHVLEPIAGYLTLAEKQLSDDNLGTDKSWNFGPLPEGIASVQYVLDKLSNIIPVEIIYDSVAQLHEAKTLRLNSNKATKHLGWHPRFSLDQAIALTADWYQAYSQKADMSAVTKEQIIIYKSTEKKISKAV